MRCATSAEHRARLRVCSGVFVSRGEGVWFDLRGVLWKSRAGRDDAPTDRPMTLPSSMYCWLQTTGIGVVQAKLAARAAAHPGDGRTARAVVRETARRLVMARCKRGRWSLADRAALCELPWGLGQLDSAVSSAPAPSVPRWLIAFGRWAASCWHRLSTDNPWSAASFSSVSGSMACLI